MELYWTPTYPRFLMEGIVPYRSSEFQVNPEEYRSKRETEETEDLMIDKLVDKTILSVLSKLSDEKAIENNQRSTATKADVKNPSSPSKVKSTKNKKDKRQKKGKKEEVTFDATVDMKPPPEPMISIPSSKFKSMVLYEVESRARRVHDFYSYQYNEVQQERAQAFTEYIRAKDRERRLEDQLKYAITEIHRHQNENEKLKQELADIKDAKKKKRKDAKQRRNQEKLLGESSAEKEERARDNAKEDGKSGEQNEQSRKMESTNYSPKNKLKPENEHETNYTSTKLRKENLFVVESQSNNPGDKNTDKLNKEGESKNSEEGGVSKEIRKGGVSNKAKEEGVPKEIQEGGVSTKTKEERVFDPSKEGGVFIESKEEDEFKQPSTEKDSFDSGEPSKNVKNVKKTSVKKQEVGDGDELKSESTCN